MDVGQVFYVVPPARPDETADADKYAQSLLGASGVGLRRGLVEGRDFQLLGLEAWNEWKAKNPSAVEIKRHVISRGSGSRAQKVVELYPLLAKVYFWANGMSKPSPVQIKRGVDLHVLLSASLGVSSVKDVLWSHITTHYHDLFPEYARKADKPGYSRENEAKYVKCVRVRAKPNEDSDWQTVDEEAPPTPFDSDDEDARKRTVEDLNLTSPSFDDDEDSCIVLLDGLFENPKNPADRRNGKFFLSDVDAQGWRALLHVGDYVDASDTTQTWYESIVVDKDETRVKVHFLSWAEKWDVWVVRDAPELQRLHARTTEWRTQLVKGMDVEYCQGPIRGLKGDWVVATVVDVQVMEDEAADDDDNDVWPRGNDKALYTGKIIRVKVQFNGETKVVEAKSEQLCQPNVHMKTKKSSAVAPPVVAPKTTYSSSSSGYHNRTSTSNGGYSSSYGAASSRYTGRPEFAGVVGLQNLGNTCFLNSVLQCLSNSKPLLEYFCRDDEASGDKFYKSEINHRNPLGMNGKIAKAMADLLSQMWSGETKVVIPSKLKHVIGEYAPAFAGYAQQDSQEVLSFILDGIHEDLNRVLEKPYTKAIEHAGRPDVVVAKEEWDNYLKRNDSIVTDHFMAQLRSHVTCPSCQNESITFDPYMSLSVPVPNEAYVSLTLYGMDGAPTQYGLRVPKEGSFGDVRAALSAVSGVPTDRLLLVQVKLHRILRAYADSMDMNEMVHDHHNVVAYELEFPLARYEMRSPNLYTLTSTSALDLNQNSPGEVALCLVALQHQLPSLDGSSPSSPLLDPVDEDDDYSTSSRSSYRYHTNHTKHRRVECRLFDVPQLVTITRDASVADIHEKVRLVTEPSRQPLFDGTPYKLHVSNARADSFIQKDLPEHSTEPLSHDVTRGSFTFTLEWTDQGHKEGYKKATPTLHPSADDTSRKPASLDLRTCIAKFTEKEQLGENNTWYCPKCKTHVRALKKFDLFSLPDILLVHLKRFRYAQNSYFVHRDKINTLVTFPIEGLDMGEFVIGPTDPNASTVYDLYAVSEHSGGLGGGHYTAKAKNPRNNKWYSFNDSYASESSADAAVTSQAYVLFYLRRQSEIQ
ncbi:Aste57867_18272 [Aphanomyces stellatus]|uniref:Aste57867_18272 protein n=1 Tax=Aphanomyces stellatus TaxID=120398 RepID=A0A485LBD5_9STRA|nr:hypothetical protein As57867_018210 [Aphanomyces stellatus]VFT95009.1 Aste57867_18272 [Aphanomyces stellatus]